MIERNHVVVSIGGGKRALTDEEWKQVHQLIMDGKIVVQSHQDSMEEKMNEILRDDLINMYTMDDSFMKEERHSQNHHWKKSNQRNHPAFRRKKR